MKSLTIEIPEFEIDNNVARRLMRLLDLVEFGFTIESWNDAAEMKLVIRITRP